MTKLQDDPKLYQASTPKEAHDNWVAARKRMGARAVSQPTEPGRVEKPASPTVQKVVAPPKPAPPAKAEKHPAAETLPSLHETQDSVDHFLGKDLQDEQVRYDVAKAKQILALVASDYKLKPEKLLELGTARKGTPYTEARSMAYELIKACTSLTWRQIAVIVNRKQAQSVADLVAVFVLKKKQRVELQQRFIRLYDNVMAPDD